MPHLVHAYKMTDTQFFYYCPFCPDIHVHGNCKDFVSNRTESRSSHCLKMGLGDREMEIVISNKTKRYLATRLHKAIWRRHSAAVRRHKKRIQLVIKEMNE